MSLANEAAAGGNVKQQIIDFMSGFTAETTPGAAAKIADYREHLRPDTTVYITFLPGSDFEQTIAVAKRLQQEGFNPVPHFAARSVPTRAFLERNLQRLQQEVGLKQALVIAGAVDKPLGEFSDSSRVIIHSLISYPYNKYFFLILPSNSKHTGVTLLPSFATDARLHSIIVP